MATQRQWVTSHGYHPMFIVYDNENFSGDAEDLIFVTWACNERPTVTRSINTYDLNNPSGRNFWNNALLSFVNANDWSPAGANCASTWFDIYNDSLYYSRHGADVGRLPDPWYAEVQLIKFRWDG
jgi:hypothetical protein